MLPILHYSKAALRQLPDILAQHSVPLPCAIICDTHTYEVAARIVEKLLGNDAVVTINLGLKLKPHVKHIATITEAAKEAASLLVVGSGTLNDLGKLAAHQLGIPYAVVATAASMNGYSSANASLIEEGLKKSFPAQAPSLIIADSDIIRRAPVRLSQAGLGDTLCRSSIQADALLSHLLFDSWYDGEYFDNARLLETQLIEHSDLLLTGDETYFETLFSALVFSGNAMALAGSSAPASQSEHIIAHCCELFYPLVMQNHLHGEHIAVTSLSSLRLQHYLLAQPFVLTPQDSAKFAIDTLFPETIQPYVKKMAARKTLTQEACDAAMQRLEDSRDRLKAECAEFSLQPEILEAALNRAEIASWPESLGLTREEYDQALKLAHLTRDRFTFLDIAAMRRSH